MVHSGLLGKLFWIEKHSESVTPMFQSGSCFKCVLNKVDYRGKEREGGGDRQIEEERKPGFRSCHCVTRASDLTSLNLKVFICQKGINST